MYTVKMVEQIDKVAKMIAGDYDDTRDFNTKKEAVSWVFDELCEFGYFGITKKWICELFNDTLIANKKRFDVGCVRFYVKKH